MNIKESVDYLNFWIKKERGSFYTIEETVQLIDRAQIGLYNDIIQKYATSQIVKDTLEPFKNKYYFTPDTTRNGLIVINDSDYFNLLNCTISYTDTSYLSNNRTSYYGLKLINEDELADRLNSQINAPTTHMPVAQELNTGVTINNYQASITFNNTYTVDDIIYIYVVDPILGNILLGSYQVTNTITTTDELAQAMYEALILNQYGYTMSINGSTIYVNPRIDLLDSINGVDLTCVLSGVTINNYQASITFNNTDTVDDIIYIYVPDPVLGNILLGSYQVTNTITTTDELAQAMYEALILNQYGYTMSINGSTIYVYPRIGLLDSINGVNLTYIASGDADITLTPFIKNIALTPFIKISQTLPKLYQIQLYPSVDSYTGTIYYMKRPVKPVYGYTVNGRQIVYSPETSTQLQWRDTDIDTILLKALSSIGINLSDQEVSQFAELKSSENYQGVNYI